MPDAIFVGYEDYDWGKRSPPLVAFKNLEEALKWKMGSGTKDFKLVEIK